MSEPCCDHPPVGSSPAASGASSGGAAAVAQARQAFGALMRATSGGGGGALDPRTKELITFALVLMTRCSPCVKHHLARARQMGITPAELEEAAWCAIAMGGAPVKMFYDEATK